MGRVEIKFGGLFNSLHESKVPQGRAWAMQNCTVDKGILRGSPRYSEFAVRSGFDASDTCYGLGYGEHSQNEVQRLTVTGTPTGGTVVLTFNGVSGGALAQDTSTIAYNADTTTLLTALEGVAGLAVGDAKVSGGPWPGAALDVTFQRQYANTDMAPLVLKTNSLTGGTNPTVTITERAKGGSEAVYLVAIKHSGASTVTMYKVNASTGVQTSIASGLTASNWTFLHFKDQIFAFNATDGLNYYRIGGSWNDGSGSKPNAPAVPPSFTYTLTPSLINFSTGFASITQSGLGGSPTVTGTATGISITNGATPVTAQTQITITAEYSSAQDFHFNDVWATVVDSPASAADVRILVGSVFLQQINNDGSPITHDPLVEYNTASPEAGVVQYSQFANRNRTQRDNILKFVIKFTVANWAASKQVTIQLHKGFSFIASNVPFTFQFGGSPTPTQAKIRYAYSYKNEATGVESDLSEAGLTDTVPAGSFGAYVILTLRGSSELQTTDRIYVYRQEKGSGLWRRLPTDANNLTTWGSANVTSSTTTFTDRWMEAELKDFQTHSLSPFAGQTAGAVPPVLGFWKQSLVAGALRKVWLSFVGDPRAFAPDPDDREATKTFAVENVDNEDAGRTFYMADDRSDEVYAVIGQDSLYMIGARASYAAVGDFPQGASPPRRLPGSRGSVSQKGVHHFGGGVHTSAPDGLWYYSVGRAFSGQDNGYLEDREETLEVRTSYIDTLLGSSYSGLVSTEYRDDIWLWNGTKYLRRSRDGGWEEGTFTDSVYAVASIRTLPLRFASSTGRIFTISDDYTDDDGTAVNWTYETGVLDGPPSKITDIELQVKGSPRITVRVFMQDGDKTDANFGKYKEYVFDTVDAQEPYRKPCSILPGMRYKILFSGTVGRDEVHSCALELQGSGKPYNG